MERVDVLFEEDFGLDLVESEQKPFRITWVTEYGGSVEGPVAIWKGLVFFGSADHNLYCLDATTGREIWRFKTGGGFFFSGPSVFDGRVYFGSEDGYVYCLEAATGRELWRFKTGDKMMGSSPVVFEGRVYFGSCDGNFYCIDSEEGKEIWRFKTGDFVCSTPAIHENKIIFGSYDTNLYCLDLSGSEMWRFKTRGCIFNDFPILIHRGIIYFGSQDRNLYAVNVENGRELWRFRAGNGVQNTVTLGDNKLFFGSYDKNFYCLNLEGRELWRFKTNGRIGGMKALVSEGKIYFGSGLGEGRFYCLSMEGKKIWDFQTHPEGIYTSPALFKNTVIFGSMDCHVYALDKNNGRELWRFQTSSTHIAKVKIVEEVPYEIKLERVKRYGEEKEERKYKRKREDNFESEYDIKSEYAIKSEYSSKGEYK